MRRVWVGSVALAMAVVGAVVITAGPASAQVDCAGERTASAATVTPSSVLPGETFTVSGGGFVGDRVLGIAIFNPPVVIGSVASSPLGYYSATIQLPLNTPPGQNEITVFGEGPLDACHQSLGLFTVRPLPVPVTIQPTIVVPVFPVVPSTITVTGAVNPVVVGAGSGVPAPIVVQQPLARTGSSSPVLVASGLLAMLLGFHVLRVTGRGRPISG